MAETLRASARTTAVASVAGLSNARGGTVRVTAGGLGELETPWLAVGPVAAGPPTTYADFDSDLGTKIVSVAAAIQVAYDQDAAAYTVTFTYPIGPSAFSEGDAVWVAVFTGGTSPPGGGEFPAATAGPFTVVA